MQHAAEDDEGEIELFGLTMQEAGHNPDVSSLLLPNVFQLCGKALVSSYHQEGTIEANVGSTVVNGARNSSTASKNMYKRQDIFFTHVDCLLDA
jgi:hypothetical protein